MIRLITLAAVIIGNFVLQTTAFQYIEILGVKPNTALILICCYSIQRDDVEGALFGFFAGLLQDIYYESAVGMFAALGVLTGYICGKPLRSFYRENYFLPMLLVTVCSFVYQFVYYISHFLFRGRTEFAFYFNTIILPGAIYTTVLTIPLFWFMYYINRLLENFEKNKRRSL